MRYVSIERAKPGMELADTIFDSNGTVIIGCDCTLNEYYIQRLQELGFGGVYIKDKRFEDIEIAPAIPQRLKTQARDALKSKDIDRCKDVAMEIVNAILSQERISLDMADLRSYDDYTYSHSVNVAVLSGALGMGMQLKLKELEYLVTAALLHDLGKLLIPQEILNKKGRLTPEEFKVMKSHSKLSYELLTENYGISAHVKQTVLFHHENVDGSGYPNGLKGEEQSILIKILHTADVYDALVSKRPYKDPYSPFDAAEYLMGASGTMFDQEVVANFVKIVPLYPKGTEVLLSDGKYYVVLENSDKHNLRPVVRRLEDGVEMDLLNREYMNITIVGADEEQKERQKQDEESRKKMIQ